MTLDTLVRNLADKVKLSPTRKETLEAYACQEGGADPCERYGRAGELIKVVMDEGNRRFNGRDFMYVKLREIEEECKLSARYDLSNPKNRKFCTRLERSKRSRRIQGYPRLL